MARRSGSLCDPNFSNKRNLNLPPTYSREGGKVDDFLALELNKRKKFLEKIVREKTAALAQSGPEGRLRCADRGGKPEYYWRKDGKDVTGAYIPVDEREFAAALAQRNYDQAVLNYAQEELCLITKLAKKRAAHSIEGVYEEYGFARKALVNPVWIPDDEFVAKWQKTKYKKRVFKEGDPEYYTKRGERVMSKTEILIGNILADLGVPYLYEFPLYLHSKGWIKPDFTALNVRTRRFLWWEHFGKMGDPEYCADNLEKILDYERDGYFPGTHLIITHETHDKPVDTRLLEVIARHYLL